MKLRDFLTILTGFLFSLAASTRDLRAVADIGSASGAEIHSLTPAELHNAVRTSSVERLAAHKTVEDFLARVEVKKQMERMGFEPASIASRVAMLGDADLLRLQTQVMEANEQLRATASVPWWGWLVVTSVLVVLALLVVGLTVGLGD